MIYIVKQILRENVLLPLAKSLNVEKIYYNNGKQNSDLDTIPSRTEVFCEHAWELIFFTFSMVVGFSALWNESYLWNFKDVAINYPFHVSIAFCIIQ